MKPTLEQRIITRSDFTRLGFEVKEEFYHPSEKRSVLTHLVVGKDEVRYILEKIIPLSVVGGEIRYKVINRYEVGE